MKGHMQDGKFHPHTEYKKGIRKSRDQSTKTEGIKIRKQRVITDDEAEKLSKKLHNKAGISNEDYVKLVEHKKSKASDLYKLYLNKFPDSNIAMDNKRWGTGIGSHGHFGDALFEGRYEDAMFRADSKNLIKLKAIGIENFLSKEKPHPDDPSPFDVFEGRYNWAKDHKGE